MTANRKYNRQPSVQLNKRLYRQLYKHPFGQSYRQSNKQYNMQLSRRFLLIAKQAVQQAAQKGSTVGSRAGWDFLYEDPQVGASFTRGWCLLDSNQRSVFPVREIANFYQGFYIFPRRKVNRVPEVGTFSYRD
jgi:hypothetical protein